MAKSMVNWFDKKFYPEFPSNWDNKMFREEILRQLEASPKEMLDIGAGAGFVKEMDFKGIASKVTGIDPDERVSENPHLDKGVVGLGDTMPFDDESFDIVISDNVLEHLPNPEQVFDEISRVLRPDGIFLAKTPNKYHYMPLIASITPHSFHQWINKKRGRPEADTFPTTYLANSPRMITKLAKRSRLEVKNIQLIEGRPEYMRFNGLTYLAGYLYERLVNLVPGLQNFRSVLIIELQKTGK